MVKLGPVDYTGRIIKEGDHVVYPVRTGSNMWLTGMIVERIISMENVSFTRPFKLIGTNDRGNRCIVKNLERCIVIS